MGRLVFGASSGSGWKVYRYLSDGRLDASFGHSGVVEVSEWDGFSGGVIRASVTSAALTEDGKLLLVGTLRNERSMGALSPRPTFVMAQLLRDGTLDPSFGNGGTVRVRDGWAGVSVDLTPTGFIVAGYSRTSGNGGAGASGLLVGFLPNGRIDRGFANNGFRIVPNRGRRHTFLLDVEVTPRGILVGGSKWNRYFVMRLKSDGSTDPKFGNGGTWIRDPSPDRCQCGLGRSMAIDRKGRIVITGEIVPPKHSEPIYTATARLTPRGKLDRSFGRRGITTIKMGGLTTPENIAIDRNDRIYIAGSTRRSGVRSSVLLRYTSRGSPDRGFAKHGAFVRRLGRSTSGWSVLPLRNGRVVQSGSFLQNDLEHAFLQVIKARQ